MIINNNYIKGLIALKCLRNITYWTDFHILTFVSGRENNNCFPRLNSLIVTLSSILQSMYILICQHIVDQKFLFLLLRSGGFKKKGPGGKRSEGPFFSGKWGGSLLKGGKCIEKYRKQI